MKSFAEKMLDSMVDENGHCGERGLSEKQFNVLSKYLEEGKWEPAGCWEGNYATKVFYTCDFTGTIGAYNVKLNVWEHFHNRYSVVSIDPRPAEDVAREEYAKSMSDFSGSEWVHSLGERVDLRLVLVREYRYEVPGYGWNADSELRFIYTFADEDGNCYVWKTGNVLVQRAEDYRDDVYAREGDTVVLRATVKEHSEYRGVKQTVVTRANVKAVVPFSL